MSDDQSFYEIQLNMPHLVLAFLGAAVVGLTVFWLGVTVGRGQSETTALETTADWQAAPPLENSVAGADSNDPPLSWEDAEQPAEQPVVSLADVAASSASAEDPGVEPPATAAADLEFQPADPVDTTPAPAAVESTPDLPAADASLASGWIVQVRSTPDENDANSLQSTLVMAGFPAFVVSAEVDSEVYYRVRVGRYESRTDADAVEARLQDRSDIESTWVTEG